MSTTYPDINISKDGYTLTIRSLFDAGRGQWETKIVDLSGQTTGKRVGQVTIGGRGVINYSSEETNMTRKNFQGIIRRHSIT